MKAAPTRFFHKTDRWLFYHPRVAIVGLFGLAWWPHLALFGGRFWDDWVLYNTTFEYLWMWTTELGFPWVSLVIWPLSQWAPSFAILGFTLLAIASVVWFEILERTPGVTRGIALLGTVLSVVAPFYLARFSWVQIQAIIGLVFFLLAWRVAIRALESFSWTRLFLFAGYLLVGVSFYAAYLALSGALILHLLWIARNSTQAHSLKSFLRLSAAASFVVITWFIVRSTYFRPSGSYEGYQQIVVTQGLLIYASLTLLFVGLGIWMVLFSPRDRASWRVLTLMTFSVLLFLLATGPYVATGQFPPYSSWGTRYEVNYFLFFSVAVVCIVVLGQRLVNASTRLVSVSLIALLVFGSNLAGIFFLSNWGAAQAIISHLQFIMVAVVCIVVLGQQLVQKKSTRWVTVSLIALLVFGSNLAGILFLSNWGKAQTIISHIAENGDIYEDRFIVFVDKEGWVNDFPGSSLIYYAWTGLVAEGTGSATSFGTTAASLENGNEIYKDYLDDPPTSRLNVVYNYHWRNHQAASPFLVVEVSPVDPGLALGNRFNCAFMPLRGCVSIKFVETDNRFAQ